MADIPKIGENNEIMRERKRWVFFGIPWTFTKYILTEKKFIIQTGLLRSTENEILLYRISDMSMTRTLFQKIFKLGTLTIYAHDKTNPTLIVKNIKNIRGFKESLSDAVEKDKIRMKLRQREVMDDYDDSEDDGDY